MPTATAAAPFCCTADREELAEALALAATVASSRIRSDIGRDCVLLTASTADGFTVSADDGTKNVRVACDKVQIESDGKALAPADKLADVVKYMDGEQVELSLSGDFLRLKDRDGHFKVYTKNPDVLAVAPPFEPEHEFRLTAVAVVRMLALTGFCVPRESDNRFSTNGVLLEAEKSGKARMVATDGRRLAMAEGSCVAGRAPKANASVMMPRDAMGLLGKVTTAMADDANSFVTVETSANRVVFSTGRLRMSTTLLERAFPPYRDIIPDSADATVTATVDTAILLGAVRRAGLMADEANRSARFVFARNLIGAEVVLTTRNPEDGEAEVTAALESMKGEGLVIGANTSYFVDALKSAEADRVSIELTTANRPIVVRADGWTYLTMPISLS